METNRTLRNMLETTCIVQARARLTPTLTHVVTYELVTSGAEDDAMSCEVCDIALFVRGAVDVADLSCSRELFDW